MKLLSFALLFVAFGVSSTVGASTLSAQTVSELALITVSGNGLVELPADFAVLVLGVQIEAETPDSAAARMTRLLDRVSDTLVTLGIPRDSLPTSRLSVRPEMRPFAWRRRRPTGMRPSWPSHRERSWSAFTP